MYRGCCKAWQVVLPLLFNLKVRDAYCCASRAAITADASKPEALNWSDAVAEHSAANHAA